MTASIGEMRSLRWRLTTYWQLGALGAREVLAYRANYLMNLVGLLLQVFLLSMVWRAVYVGRDEVDGVSLSTMVAYVTLVNVQNWLVMVSTFSLVPDRIREGKIAFDLCRPIGLVAQVTAGQIGRIAAMAPFAVAVLPLAALIGEVRPPAGLGSAAAYGISLALAFLIGALASGILGMVAFWTFEIRGIQFIYRNVATFFAGALVPLWFMPDWLRLIAEALPFQAMAYTPVSIYLGRLSGAELWQALALQGFWVAALAALAFLVWRRALYKVVIQGG